MAYVVAEPCINCKFTDCVAVCPVDSFHQGENFVVINPDDCIECGACEAECPANAIFEEDELPEKWQEYIELNERFAASWPKITEQRDPLPTAEESKDVEGKRDLLSENPGA